MRLGVFLITAPPHHNLNVITSASNRETAKGMAQAVLGGNPEHYTVTPVTENGTRTIFVTVTETVERTS